MSASCPSQSSVGMLLQTMYSTSVALSCDHRSEEHTSELQSQSNLVCRLLLEKKKTRGILRLDGYAHPGDAFTSYELSVFILASKKPLKEHTANNNFMGQPWLLWRAGERSTLP